MKTINYYVNKKLNLDNQSVSFNKKLNLDNQSISFNEKLNLNKQTKTSNYHYGDDFESMCHLLYDKMYEWHQEYSKNKKLLNSFIKWLESDINSMTAYKNSGNNIYNNVISELYNVDKITKDEYNKFLNHKDINKIVEFCLFIMVKIINNPNQMMKSFSETMKEWEKWS